MDEQHRFGASGVPGFEEFKLHINSRLLLILLAVIIFQL